MKNEKYMFSYQAGILNMLLLIGLDRTKSDDFNF